MDTYSEFHNRSINDREKFWSELSSKIYWKENPKTICDTSNSPFTKWFIDGKTNLAFNCIDRHLPNRSDQVAIKYISTEADIQKDITYGQLNIEVNTFASILKNFGIKKGDRVLIYMPMIPEAVFAMLASVKIGAIHSVVFGGFASDSLALRINDASPKLIITADCGLRAGKVIEYKPLLSEAIKKSNFDNIETLLVNRGISSDKSELNYHDYDALRKKFYKSVVDTEWLESNEPSYILYTSGTTGNPKGIQRDTGGYCVALAASMEKIYCGLPGETMFTTSDIGWVVGHSYIVYGPLINGMTTILYEGLPINPDPGIWWKIADENNVSVMFSSPTGIRVLKKHDINFIKKYSLDKLKHLFLAGEPLDETTHQWISDALNKPVIDNFWQTETGWPILSAQPGVDKTPIKFGSPSFPVFGYDLKILDDKTHEEISDDKKGVVTVKLPLPPGFMTTVWNDDQRFKNTYFHKFGSNYSYTTFDWGIRDKDGYYYILGRTDDVINVAGHRLGTREIEEVIQNHTSVSEVAVIGVKDEVKGQVPFAFVVLKTNNQNKAESHEIQVEIQKLINETLGAIARPQKFYFVNLLPKTRSGKLLRRGIQAICEGRPTGDLSTIEDPTALDEIKKIISN